MSGLPVLYLMCPVPLYSSPALAEARQFPFGTLTGCPVDLVVAADLFCCNRCWLAQWPGLRSRIRFGVFLDHLGGWVGRGTFAEVMELLGLSVPVWWFRGGEPTDSFRFGEPNHRDWARYYRPVMAAERLRRVAVSISFEDNVAYWEGVAAKAALGANAAADAMAAYIARRIAEDTLRRRKHAPGQYYKAKPGDPPASATGKLADSMIWEPAFRGLRAGAIVTSTDKRAGLFEFGGCVLTEGSRPIMKWRDSGRSDNPSGWWWHHRLPLSGTWPEHPFVRRTVEEAIDDGGLRRAAIDGFRPYDP